MSRKWRCKVVDGVGKQHYDNIVNKLISGTRPALIWQYDNLIGAAVNIVALADKWKCCLQVSASETLFKKETQCLI